MVVRLQSSYLSFVKLAFAHHRFPFLLRDVGLFAPLVAEGFGYVGPCAQVGERRLVVVLQSRPLLQQMLVARVGQ